MSTLPDILLSLGKVKPVRAGITGRKYNTPDYKVAYVTMVSAVVCGKGSSGKGNFQLVDLMSSIIKEFHNALVTMPSVMWISHLDQFSFICMMLAI